MMAMSNVKKGCEILRDNGNGGFFVVSGKVVSGEEHKKIVRQAVADDEQRIIDGIADADAVLTHSIGRGRELLERARTEAQAAVRSAKGHGFSKGFNEGLSQGYSEGIRLSLEEKQPLIDTLSLLSQRLSEYYGKPVEKNAYINKAFELAERVISMELAKNDDAFFGLYRKAALHISNTDTANLKVGPRGYSVVHADKKKFENTIEGLNGLKTTLTGDNDGLCLLETPLGNIDASVGAQLSRAKKIILPQG
jgi:flagellar assembly protein FliH